MQKLQAFIWSALLLGGLASCAKEEVDPSAGFAVKNDSAVTAYAAAKNLNGTRTASGLYYVITKANPAGKKAALGEELEYSYTAYNLLDTLIQRIPATNPVYAIAGLYRTFIPGLDEGLLLMREGETATFLIPSYIGIGATNISANLPAYSVVRFDVALSRSRSEEQQIDEYVTNNKLTVTEKTTSGLRFIKTQASPTGAVPTAGQTLTVRYSGKLLRGVTPFDSTGTATRDIILGQNAYIKGFEEGFSKLKVGEKATVVFPSSLGYGTSGRLSGNNYVIPPYAPLRFDLEVVSAK